MLPLKNTKKLLLLSLIGVVVSLIVYVSLLSVIRRYVGTISDLELELEVETQKEKRLGSLVDLIDETAVERATIDKFFVTDGTLVEFITTIESLADQVGVDLETSQVDITPGVGSGIVDNLVMGVNVFGSWEQVYKFFQILEHVSYDVILTRASLERHSEEGSVASWKGSFVIDALKLKGDIQ